MSGRWRGRRLSPTERCLFTLTGAAGSGKTRLALEVADQLCASFNKVLAVVDDDQPFVSRDGKE